MIPVHTFTQLLMEWGCAGFPIQEYITSRVDSNIFVYILFFKFVFLFEKQNFPQKTKNLFLRKFSQKLKTQMSVATLNSDISRLKHRPTSPPLHIETDRRGRGCLCKIYCQNLKNLLLDFLHLQRFDRLIDVRELLEFCSVPQVLHVPIHRRQQRHADWSA